MTIKKKVTKLVYFIVGLCFLFFCFGCSAQASEFKDVNHWAKNYINYTTEKGLFVGTSTTTFNPDNNMTRGQFITVLSRYAKITAGDYINQTFDDVNPESYFFGAIAWASSNNIVEGTSDNIFMPNSSITREDAAIVICRYLDYSRSQTSHSNMLKKFKDEKMISDYAINAVHKLIDNNIICGYSDNSFRPLNKITRAEVCVIFTRLYGKECEIHETAQEDLGINNMSYLGSYKLTCYCSGCNSPKGSRATASGKLATAGEYGTIAVHPSLYKELGAGTVLYIEGLGYRTIQDKHGVSNRKIDVYIGEGSCKCNNNPIGDKYTGIYIVN